MRTVAHWVGGKEEWEGTSQRRGDVFDPATGTVEAQVPLASAADVDTAVERGDGLRERPNGVHEQEGIAPARLIRGVPACGLLR